MKSQAEYQCESRVLKDFDTQQLQAGAAKIGDGVLNTVKREKVERCCLPQAYSIHAVYPPAELCEVEISSGSCRPCERRSREGLPGE